jgi:hypothetical protein
MSFQTETNKNNKACCFIQRLVRLVKSAILNDYEWDW